MQCKIARLQTSVTKGVDLCLPMGYCSLVVSQLSMLTLMLLYAAVLLYCPVLSRPCLCVFAARSSSSPDAFDFPKAAIP